MKNSLKNSLLIGLIASSSALSAQEDIRVEATIENLSDKARVFVYKNQQLTDSLTVSDSKFTFIDKADQKKELEKALFLVAHDGVRPKNFMNVQVDAVNVFLEPGTIKITAIDSISNAHISGTPINEQEQEFGEMQMPSTKARRLLYTHYRQASKEEQKTAEFKKKSQKLEDEYERLNNKTYADFVTKYPNSPLSLKKIVEGFRPSYSDKDFQMSTKLFALLSPAMQQSEKGKELASALEKVALLAVGQKAIDFTQNDVNGNPVSLSSFKGKYVLVDFWASWCGPCRAENPHVVSAFHQFKDKGFTVLGISLDKETDRDKWLKAIEDDKLAWTQVSDLKFWKNEVAALYNVRAIPQNYLIDPNGIIVAKNLRGEALTSKLAEILN